ncbi:hypothetical protein Tco_0448248 [Tanacetum coccineum]
MEKSPRDHFGCLWTLVRAGLRLVPSCCVIFDLEPMSLSFDLMFSSKIFKSFPCLSLYLAILRSCVLYKYLYIWIRLIPRTSFDRVPACCDDTDERFRIEVLIRIESLDRISSILRHGELITIFGAVVKLTLGELLALWLSCSWIYDALAVRHGDSSSSVPMLLGLAKSFKFSRSSFNLKHQTNLLSTDV